MIYLRSIILEIKQNLKYLLQYVKYTKNHESIAAGWVLDGDAIDWNLTHR